MCRQHCVVRYLKIFLIYLNLFYKVLVDCDKSIVGGWPTGEMFFFLVAKFLDSCIIQTVNNASILSPFSADI